MEMFFVATEKSWWVILAILGVGVLLAIFSEVFRRKNFAGKYLKFIPVLFCICCSISSLLCSLIFVWWLALPLCVGVLFFIRMEEKSEILRYFRSKGETVEDYKPYQSNLFAMCSCAFLYYMIGVIIQFYYEL